MTHLAATLARFNRKERYWLLSAALGEKSRVLDDGFRQQLDHATGLTIPATAWWAMDYHLDWLVGALHLLGQATPVAAIGPPICNDEQLIRGTHEDIDLIVAFENTVLLIEAKGDTAWSNEQIGRKLQRLSAIIEKFKPSDDYPAIVFKLVLMSPSKPQKLKMEKETQSPLPEWMLGKDGTICHVPMWVGDSKPEFDTSKPRNSYIPNGINRLAALFRILVVARF